MKQLKTTASSLRAIFERNITVAHVTEPLLAVPSDTPASEAQACMTEHDFYVLGVTRGNIVCGYVLRHSTHADPLRDHIVPFGINGVAAQLLTFIFSLCQMLRPDPVRYPVRLFSVSV